MFKELLIANYPIKADCEQSAVRNKDTFNASNQVVTVPARLYRKLTDEDFEEILERQKNFHFNVFCINLSKFVKASNFALVPDDSKCFLLQYILSFLFCLKSLTKLLSFVMPIFC